MAVAEVCLFNKFGHCKYQATCRKRHINTICEKEDCEVENCCERHPRECNYYKVYNRCKFGSFCSFAHKTSEDEKIENLRTEINGMKVKIEKLEFEVNLKNQQIEFIMKALKRDVKSKTVSSNELSKLIEDDKDIQEKEVDEEHQEQTLESSFKCEICGYETSSRKGVNIHRKKVHKQEIIGNESNLEDKEASSDVRINQSQTMTYCEECDLVFACYELLSFRNHCRDEHGWFCCELQNKHEGCDFTSIRHEELKRHMLTCDFLERL